jgi:nitroreductase
MDVTQAIREKRAIRVFRPEPLPEDILRRILAAGRRAQSAKNTQPWHFIAVTEKPTLAALAKTGTYAGHLAGAALGVVIATPDPAQKWSIAFDAGQAAAYMQLAAWALGVGSCLASIYEPEAARALLGVPPEWDIHIAISFGFFDLAGQPPSGVRTPGRRPMEDIVHWEKW